jgi:hypothetical protein
LPSVRERDTVQGVTTPTDIDSKIFNKFSDAVLAKIASLSSAEIASSDPLPPDFVETILREETVALDGPPTYTIDKSNQAQLRFPLRGRLDLLEEEGRGLLGGNLKLENKAVVASVKGDKDPRATTKAVKAIQQGLDGALAAFNTALASARRKLYDYAQLSRMERRYLEETLTELRFQPAAPPEPGRYDGLAR